jgi:hypothetical protein
MRRVFGLYQKAVPVSADALAKMWGHWRVPGLSFLLMLGDADVVAKNYQNVRPALSVVAEGFFCSALPLAFSFPVMISLQLGASAQLFFQRVWPWDFPYCALVFHPPAEPRPCRLPWSDPALLDK